jgi:long-chain fatty acid transport protein
MKRTLIMSLMLAGSCYVFAEGYQVNLQSTRQVGMGHTGTGLNLGSSAMHFNPGALSLMKGNTDFQVGGSLIFSHNTFQKDAPSTYKATTDNPTSTPFYFYGATHITDKLVAGLSVTTPYGNSLVWGDNWDGRYLIQDISFKVISFQPTLSYKFSDKLSVGAGFVYATGDVELHKALPFADANGQEGQVALEGSTHNYGYNVGVFFQPTEKLSIGLDYRSLITMKMDAGNATFSTPSALSNYFPDTKFSAELPLPANLVLGVGFQASEKLLVAVDLQYVFWSAYQSLDFDFEQNTSKLADSQNERHFENTLIYRIGAEYTLNTKFKGRLGFAYDSTPIPEGYLTPETPGANKLNFCAGFSYTVNEKLSFDASFEYIKALERNDGYDSANFYGTYNTNAFIPGFGVNYTF